MSPSAIDTIRRALAEDLGAGDITSECFIPPDHTSLAQIVAKEACIIAGTDAAVEVFRSVDPSIEVVVEISDGKFIPAGRTILTARGHTRALLAAERTALNFLQRLSGIATLTREFVNAVAGTKTAILDTRKTTPGLREFERLAVAAGGGTNHRLGLFDQVLAKDNHLVVARAAAALQAAVDLAKQKRPDISIEIECDDLGQVRTLLALRGIDIILLDNMDNEQLREAVRLRGSSPVLLEASGGVNLLTVRAIADTGVDRISVGALTHSARAVDLSMEVSPSSALWLERL